MDSLGYTHNNITVFFKRLFYIGKEFFLVKICFRQINKQRIISFVFTCKCSCSSQPSCMTSHDLDDGYGFFFIYTGIQCNFTYCGSHISGSTAKSRSMICMNQVIVNGLGFTNHPDGASDLCGVSGKLADSVHGIVTANIKEPANVHLFKLTEKFRVHRILQRFRKFVTAGAKVSPRSIFQCFQAVPGKGFAEIKNCSLQKTFDSIYHSINMFDFISMCKAFRNHSVKTAVDYCCRTAGLTDNEIFFCHIVSPIFVL